MQGSQARSASSKKYYDTHREEKGAYNAAYYQAHREETSAYNAAYRADHKEEKGAYNAAYYDANGDAFREKQRQKYAEFTEWLQILRTNNGCEDCETHEGLLEHHHVDPSTKKYKVSRMYSCSLDALEAELEKCVVLCRSCHAKRHPQQETEGRRNKSNGQYSSVSIG